MPETRSSSSSGSQQEFLTIRISKLTVINGLLAVIVVAALGALFFRERTNDRVALANTASAPQRDAIAPPSAPPFAPQGQPEGAGIPRPAAQPTAAKSSDSSPLPESQARSETAVDSSVANPSEAARVEVLQRPVVYFEPQVATDTTDTQPEVKPEDPLQPAQPDQPAASSPATPDPPPARPAPPISQMTLLGAGATYPYPLYSKWFDDYGKLNPQIQFSYQSVGSGAGLRALLDGVVDFSATDVPATDEQLSHAKTRILNIPTVLGAIVPVYNIPGSREILFTPEILAGIFLGKIVSWNDPAIAKVNPAVNLPNLPIVVIHRADGSAATFTFTDYLSKVSLEWQREVGKGTSVNWPVGLGAKGNEGIAAMMRHTHGAIGYVDLLYAAQNRMPFGRVSNMAGNFVKASLRSLTEAAEAAASVIELPAGSGISITNASGKDAYPIASFTWILAPQRSKDPAKGQDLAAFLYWMADAGQPLAENLGYAPLPRKIIPQVKKIIAQLR